ncbi:MAG: 1-acyl-sn-glycerol-3-phosphate acyltransferase [Bacteriovoracaceae bacterium]
MRILFTQLKAFAVAAFVFPAVALVALLYIPFSLQERIKRTSYLWKWISEQIMRHVCEAKIDIAEDYRSPGFQTKPPFGLYVANHQSYIDIPLIFTMYQVPPIMKKEVLYIPIVGLMGWIAGAMPVSRSSHGSRKKVFIQTKNRILEDRIGVQVYPEGTRSKVARPKSFEEVKKTLLIFAWNEKIPVIPNSIYGTRGVLTDKGLVRPGRHVGIIIHKEILPENYASADEFAFACWSKVLEGYDQMEKKLKPLNESLS